MQQLPKLYPVFLLGLHILSWTHTSTGTHLSTGHTLSQSKKGSNLNSARPATCNAMQMRSRLLVEAPTRHPTASVTEALFSISFSLQLNTKKTTIVSTRAHIQSLSSIGPILVKIFEVVERWVLVEVWVHDSTALLSGRIAETMGYCVTTL